MAPRYQTLRPAQTASAREAMRSFFCELCQKGYSRMNEYEAHLSSYDHSHKQRLKDMKAMVRDPAATARARRLEAKAADAVISIKLGEGDDGEPQAQAAQAPLPSAADGTAKKGGFRKGGFRSAFVAEAVPVAAAVRSSPDAKAAPLGRPGAADAAMPAISLPAVAAPPPSTGAPTAAASRGALPPPLPLVGAAQRLPTPPDESDTEDEGYEVYDPARPTD